MITHSRFHTFIFPIHPQLVGISWMDSITSRGIYIERESGYYSFATLNFEVELTCHVIASFASSEGGACHPNIQESAFKLHPSPTFVYIYILS